MHVFQIFECMFFKQFNASFSNYYIILIMYKKRLIDLIIEKNLRVFSIIYITGPRHCGKTTTAKRFANSEIFLSHIEHSTRNDELVKLDINLATEGKKPRLIDEWQLVPKLWDQLRIKSDLIGKTGLYIITGSVIEDRKDNFHSGIGRVKRIEMNTLSLYEKDISSGDVSLQKLFNNEYQKLSIVKKNEVIFEKIVEEVMSGGWPRTLELNFEEAINYVNGYKDLLLNLDESYLINKNIDIKKYKLLLRSLARNEGTYVKLTTLQKDIKDEDDVNLDIRTIKEYLLILKSLYIIKTQETFSPNFLSSLRIKENGKIRFVDPSLPISILNLSKQKLMNNLNIFGNFFESLVIRDLNVYMNFLDGKVFQVKKDNGFEIDAILEYKDGTYAAVEIKTGLEQVDKAAKDLLNFQKNMQAIHDKAESKRKMNENIIPSFLMVITSVGRIAYQREDNVFVVPITMLKP